MKQYVIGVNNCGKNIKAGLYDSLGNELCVVGTGNEVFHLQGGREELDLEQLWLNNCKCIRSLIDKSKVDPSEIACIGIAGQGKGVYAVDKDGRPVGNAITSSDRRSLDYSISWFQNGLIDKLFDRIYQGQYTSHPTTILAWMKDNDRERYDRIHWLFSMKDYINYRMTGRPVADYCNQSGNGFINFNTDQYDISILEDMGIPEIYHTLPPLYHSTDVIGTVTEEAAELTGLEAGTKVVCGLFDANASALAMGAIDSEPLCILMGTCSVNAYISPRPIVDRSIMLNSVYCVPGYYYIEEGSSTSISNLDWVLQELFPWELAESKISGKSIFDKLEVILENVDVKSTGAIFLPYLEGAPISEHSSGTWLNLRTMDTREDMLLAVYEGIAFAHKDHFLKLLKSRPCPKAIRIAGSSNSSKVWMQIFADVFQLPVEIIDSAELGTRGVSMVAGIAAGFYPDYESAVHNNVRVATVYTPNKDNAEIYRIKYENYRYAAKSLVDFWDHLQKQDK